MTKSTFSVLFYLKRQAERNGKVPVMERIAVDGTISQFRGQRPVSPELWDPEANKASDKSIAARHIRDIETDIGKQYQRIGDRNAYVTAEKVKNARSGFGAVIDFYIADFRRVSRRIRPKTGSCIFHPESAEMRTFRHADKTDAPKHETQRGSCRSPTHTTAAPNDSFARNEAETEKIVIFTPRTERSVGSYDSYFPPDMEGLLDLGYIGLFIGSFVAATVVPFSSDVLLIGMLAAGGDIAWSVSVATLGNWAGGLTSYWLGWIGKWEWIEKYMRVKHETLVRHKDKVDRFGALLALLTWLPFIGDVFAIALGFYRVDFKKSAVLMLVGKGARFVAWALLFVWGKQYIQ